MTAPHRLATVLHNPTAGAGKAFEASRHVARALEAEGYIVEQEPTTGPGSATTLAREAAERKTALLVVVGGDGSVREALVGLGADAQRIPTAVIPCGNANVVARELGVPLAVERAIELLANGEPRLVDVGRIGEEIFLAMVGAGWDARTTALLGRLRQTRFGARWYAVWADSAYLACGLAALFTWPPPRLRLEVDGHLLPGRYCAAVVANFATYGKGWSLVPGASFTSGVLHYQARKRFGFPFVAIQLIAGMVRKPVPRFVSDYGSGRAVVLRAMRPVPVHVDGDYRGLEAALELHVRPLAALLVAPVEPARAGRPPSP